MSSSETASEQPKMTSYDGGCHCGQIKYNIKISPSIEEARISDCNCSLCVRNGLHYTFVKDEDVEWKSGRDLMTGYQFNKMVVTHSFCPKCGTNICAISEHPNFFPGKTAINVSTIDGLDLSSLSYKKVDGKSF